jgi:hypothetical protein
MQDYFLDLFLATERTLLHHDAYKVRPYNMFRDRSNAEQLNFMFDLAACTCERDSKRGSIHRPFLN